MHYSSVEELIIIGYESGIIDLIDTEGTITTIKTIYESTIVANKAIHDIESSGSKAYLATDFGVVLLELINQSVNEKILQYSGGHNGTLRGDSAS